MPLHTRPFSALPRLRYSVLNSTGIGQQDMDPFGKVALIGQPAQSTFDHDRKPKLINLEQQLRFLGNCVQLRSTANL